METATQLDNLSGVSGKPTEPVQLMNSQGERIIEAASQAIPSDPLSDVISLSDTPLGLTEDGLCPPTDDSGLEHKIISCGHVLKSTHDLARWSEKTGAHRVNDQESIDSISDLAVNLNPPSSRGYFRRSNSYNNKNNTNNNKNNTNNNNNNNNTDPSDDIRGLFNEGKSTRGISRSNSGGQQWKAVDRKSEVINCWPVLKSTHDQALLSEKRGRGAVNQAAASNSLEEIATNQQQGQAECPQQQGQAESTSHILHSWPVLKSTHDQADLSEKRGRNAVNKPSASGALEEIVQNQEGRQAGNETGSAGFGIGGSSLQSGLDTQGGTHVQLDSSQELKETPDIVMQKLRVHV